MKMRKILAAVSAITVAATMAVSASALADNQKAYQFGGAQVSWGWDADGDKEDDSLNGVNGETWLGTLDVATGSGKIAIPVEKGAVVDIYCLSWDSITDAAIFTATIDGKSYDCYYSTEKPAVTYTVEDDITTLEVDIQWIVLEDGVDGAINDWCGAGVIVTAPDAADEPAEDKPAEDKPAEDKPAEDKPAEDKPAEDKPAEDKPADDGNKPTGATAGLALAGLALAGAAIVATKKNK